MAMETKRLSVSEAREIAKRSSTFNRLAKAWEGGHIKTMADLEILTYGFSISDPTRLEKAQVTYNTVGLTNDLTGMKLYRNIAYSGNAFSVLGMQPYNQNGYKTITAAGSAATPGVALGGNIPTPVVITAAELSIIPTLSAASFEIDSTAAKVNPKNDSVSWWEYKQAAADEFANRLDLDLLTSNENNPASNVGLVSLDRVVASHDELLFGNVADTAAITAQYLDIYGKDRDSADSVYDAYVSGQAYGTGDGSRTLTISIIDDLIAHVKRYWARQSFSNKFMLTGPDTGFRISQLYAATGRIDMPTKQVQYGVEGVQSVSGVDAGFQVSALYGIPIIEDFNVVQDDLARIYLLDKDNIHIGVVTPPTLIETSESDFLTLGRFAIQGAHYMEGALVCTCLPGQGKARDLK